MIYLNKDTISEGKIRSTKWAENNSDKANKGLCVYLVGSPLGLNRHIEDKKRLGFNDLTKHIIVERDEATHQALFEACAQLYPQIQVIKGDFIEILRNIVGQIDHIDFDSVETFNTYSEQLIQWAAKNKVQNLHIVNSTRCSNLYMTNKAIQLNVKFIRKWGNKRYIIGPPKAKDLIPTIIISLTDVYNAKSMSYKSLGPNHGGQSMVITVLNLK